MASLHYEEIIRVPAQAAWALLRQVDKAHALFADVLTDCRMTGDIRTVTFANGMVVDERVIAVEDARRRLVYTVLGDMFEHHSASMAIVATGGDACRFVWISDFLPDALTGTVAPLVEAGSAALARNIERMHSMADEPAPET